MRNFWTSIMVAIWFDEGIGNFKIQRRVVEKGFVIRGLCSWLCNTNENKIYKTKTVYFTKIKILYWLPLTVNHENKKKCCHMYYTARNLWKAVILNRRCVITHWRGGIC